MSPRRLYDKLTSQEWQGWLDFIAEEPFGDLRDDMRMDAFRERLVATMFGGNEYARASFPYWEDEKSTDELMAMAANTQANIEPDGKGGYRWLVQPLLD